MIELDGSVTLKIGDKFRWYDRDIWHVVVNFTDKDTNFAVLKSWSKYKNRWIYKVESYYCINEFMKIQEEIKKVKK